MSQMENSSSKTFRKRGHPQNAEQAQVWEETSVNDTLNAFDNNEHRTSTLVVDQGGGKAVLSIENHPNDSRCKIRDDGTVQTLSSRMGTGGNNVPMVLEPILLESNQNHATIQTDGISTALPAAMGMGGGYIPMVVEKENSSWDGSQIAPTLTSNNAGGNQRMPDKENFNAVIDQQGKPKSVVRRLTPIECERLQGYPDNWTNIGAWVGTDGKERKESSDTSRYKALGNSIALPFWAWMAERMVAVLKRDGVENPTMASLFDGIGGFPLVFSRCGCTPVWASEIEEFAIAVTKRRFPDGNGI